MYKFCCIHVLNFVQESKHSKRTHKEIVIFDVKTTQYRDVLDYLHLSVKTTTTTTRCTTTKEAPNFTWAPQTERVNTHDGF